MLYRNINKTSLGVFRRFNSGILQFPSAAPPNDPTIHKLKLDILSTALDLVPNLGWTQLALYEACKANGYPPTTHGILENGPIDLVHYFLKQRISDLSIDSDSDVKSIAPNKNSELSTPSRIKKYSRKSLNFLIPFIDTWPQALALMSQPQNIPSSLYLHHELIDNIWYLAGDKSVDMNWYSKRFILSAVYSSTELFMTADKSPDFTDTFDFLDNRLGDVAKFGKISRDFKSCTAFLNNSIKGLKNNGFKNN